MNTYDDYITAGRIVDDRIASIPYLRKAMLNDPVFHMQATVLCHFVSIALEVGRDRGYDQNETLAMVEAIVAKGLPDIDPLAAHL